MLCSVFNWFESKATQNLEVLFFTLCSGVRGARRRQGWRGWREANFRNQSMTRWKFIFRGTLLGFLGEGFIGNGPPYCSSALYFSRLENVRIKFLCRERGSCPKPKILGILPNSNQLHPDQNMGYNNGGLNNTQVCPLFSFFHWSPCIFKTADRLAWNISTISKVKLAAVRHLLKEFTSVPALAFRSVFSKDLCFWLLIKIWFGNVHRDVGRTFFILI